jgi:hypothetical protein
VSDQPQAADVWADGALTTAEARAFIKRGTTSFYAEAKRLKWPRRYRGLGALWPKRVLMDYLANLPAVRGSSRKE